MCAFVYYDMGYTADKQLIKFQHIMNRAAGVITGNFDYDVCMRSRAAQSTRINEFKGKTRLFN